MFKKSYLWLFLNFSFLLPFGSCSSNVQKANDPLFDFADSVTIIRTLLQSNSLSKILENSDPADLDFLINNFSPAQIAFESEVLNCTLPVLIYFYQKDVTERTLLRELAVEYADRLKIVLVEEEKFPTICKEAQIDEYPTVLLVDKRVEIGRIEGRFSRDAIERLIKKAF